MDDLRKFKNKIFLYGIIVMFICEVISLPFLGFDIKFTYGLVLGTAISIVNFNIMSYTMTRVLSGKSKFMTFAGYIIRLLIYGGVFYMAIKVSLFAGLGTIIGFITLKVAIIYLHGIKPKVRKGGYVKSVEAEKEVLEKKPFNVRYCKGRAVMTHKKTMMRK